MTRPQLEALMAWVKAEVASQIADAADGDPLYKGCRERRQTAIAEGALLELFPSEDEPAAAIPGRPAVVAP